MPPKQPFQRITPTGKLVLYVLAVVYPIYLFGMLNFSSTPVANPGQAIVEHQVETAPNAVLRHWTVAAMREAADDSKIDTASTTLLTQTGTDTQATITKGKAAKQQGQAPSTGVDFPLSTVGKVFMTNEYGQNMVCSGTAIVSNNKNTVDTAGHCLYWSGEWVTNVIFCPLYDNGNTPYGCWAAQELQVPKDWLNPNPNDLHHDMGMIIVAPNDKGNLTDLVGGTGWAYNQAVDERFYAYGYPAASPFDGQTRKSCSQGDRGTSWKHGGGTVVSIPCDMTGGCSGGAWFIKVGNDWYLNGHNDFTSSMRPGHMFSPYYDDTWYELYQKAQSA